MDVILENMEFCEITTRLVVTFGLPEVNATSRLGLVKAIDDKKN